METTNLMFAVIAEVKDNDKPLYLHNLNFARLMDDIVVPYQNKDPFFIDGVPTKSENLKRIKIIQQKESFAELFDDLHNRLRLGMSSGRRVPAEDYQVKLYALFREAGEDVTSQVIKAYDTKIKPSIADYLPKREELISGALKVFIEAMKILGRSI